MVPGRDSLPNLVVPGLPRAGTTWLYRALSLHPEVFVPRRKEVHYHDRHHARPVSWYRRHFRGGAGLRYRVDITPFYLLDPACAERIQRVTPEALILIILRNPVTWLWSRHQKTSRERGPQPSLDTLVADADWRGTMRYQAMIEPYLHRFGREGCRILVYEDLARDPLAYFRDVCAFLQIDPGLVTPRAAAALTRAENPSVVPRSASLNRLLHGMLRVGRRASIGAVDRMLDAGGRWYRRLLVGPSRPGARPEMPDSLRQKIAIAFRDDAEAVSDLVGRDLLALWKLEELAAGESR